MTEDDLNQRLDRIEESIAALSTSVLTLRADIATKADLEELRAEIKTELADVAQNVTVRHLGEQVAQAIRETLQPALTSDC